MEQESISRNNYNHNKRIAIIGGGPAGCICAKFLTDTGFDTTIFDSGKILRTLLPTGGGRCNLAHSEFEIKELARNYPRGEKFLYSVFSKFGTQETLDFFKSIGVETYTQDDNRIFPISNSSNEVREKLLNSIKNYHFEKENVINIEKLDNCYKIITNKCTYAFDYVVIATGGHSGYKFLNNLGIKINEPVQALVGLQSIEDFSDIAGVSLKNIKVNGKELKNIGSGDIIFTHRGLSGPLIYKISSIFAKKFFPYKINLQLIKPFNLQEYLDKKPHKEIKNLLGEYIPKSLVIWILKDLNIDTDISCCKINGKTRDLILQKLTNFEITVTGKNPDGEIVTCGGVDLNEVNSKTMESKKYNGLYFAGEVLDIDGFCGGFNLQNCWSTGYIAAESIINNLTYEPV